MASNIDAQRARQEIQDHYEYLLSELTSFIRVVYSDGDSTVDTRDIPQILRSISAEFANARDDRANCRSAVIDLVLLARRIARAKDPEKRSALMVHVVRIGESVGCATAGILRAQSEEALNDE